MNKNHKRRYPNSFSLITKKEALFNNNIWDFKDLGFRVTEYSSNKKSINFDNLIYPWLIDLMKITVWRKRNAVGASTLIAYIRNMVSLIKYSSTLKENLKIEDLNHDLFEGYFSSLSSKSLATQSSYYSGISEVLTCWREWGYLEKTQSILPRDLKPRMRRKTNPKSISPFVQQQIIESATPPQDFFHRWVLIMLEIGARGQEALHLTKDSLNKDMHGWSLTRDNKKFNKQITIPISENVANLIQKQIDHANSIEEEEGYKNEEGFIFIHCWRGQIVPYTVRNINVRIKNFLQENSILDEKGIQPSISTHSFRHTVATNLINNGVSQLHVQKFLGHESPQMTNVYAEIHDSTMRTELMKSNAKMTDIRGRLYSVLDVANEINTGAIDSGDIDLDLKWLRKNIATQILPNGVCALPIMTSCNHANACLSCPSFRSGKEHLEMHKSQRERTKNIIASAKESGYLRQAEINSKVLNNINSIIKALESEK